MCYAKIEVSVLLKWYELNTHMHSKISFNTSRPKQIGRHVADDVFKCIFLNENAWISIAIALKFVPKVPINNIPTLV